MTTRKKPAAAAPAIAPAAPQPESSRLPFLRPPGAVPYWLGNSISALRQAASWTISAESPVMNVYSVEWLLDFFRAEWAALGPEGAEHVLFLAAALRQERSLLAIEYMAHALAVQGEDGATELIDLLVHDDLCVRSKAAIGLSSLGSTGRWAVPVLARRMVDEPCAFVGQAIVCALGEIGGPRAEEALERVEWRASEALAYSIREALGRMRSRRPE